ncbi:MAG: histidine phosphatase family protein [Thermodesulfobacteriota bacterium]
MQSNTMPYTRLYLIRHGEVVNHHEYRYNGHHDVDITERGVDQMTRMAAFLSERSINALYSSDLTRTEKGAEIIGRALGLSSESLPAFRELHLGRWEGLTREEATERFPEDSGFTFANLATDKIEGGETLQDLSERVLPELNGLIDKHRGGSICLVAHGGVNRVILCPVMGVNLERFFSFEQDYGCLNIVDYFPDGIAVVKLLNGGPNQLLGETKLY